MSEGCGLSPVVMQQVEYQLKQACSRKYHLRYLKIHL